MRCDVSGSASAASISETVCDARVQLVSAGPGGRPVGIGRRSRVVPSSPARLLRHRDHGCRFPGCNRTRWVHAHHATHWADGGGTDLDNLVLCWAHHRFVHEGRVRVEGHPSGRLRFVVPGGREFRVGPPGMRDEIRRRIRFEPGLPDWLAPAHVHPPPVFMRR